jgi:hypothetical protein
MKSRHADPADSRRDWLHGLDRDRGKGQVVGWLKGARKEVR